VPEILSLLLSSLGTRMLSDVRQAALEFRTEIGRFGRDLDGHASGFTPIEPPKRKQVYCDFEPDFLGAGYAGKKFPSPETLKAQTLFSVSPLADVVCRMPSKIAE